MGPNNQPFGQRKWRGCAQRYQNALVLRSNNLMAVNI